MKDDAATIRRAVRRHLAERPTAAQSADVIHFFIKKSVPCELGHVEEALAFLSGLEPPQVKYDYDDLGPAKCWQITGEGILAHERNR